MSLLESIGVGPAGVLTTGDEAIEVAYTSRTKEPGNAIGINLRVAPYADVKTDTVEKIAAILQNFALRQTAPLLPIPIAFHEYANDHHSIRLLLAGFDDESDGGFSLDTPLMLVRQTARCRIVVTGAYHAAVFALAQGIPVVCLTNSPYYLAKFQGLKDLFGLGCSIVTLSAPDLSSKFEAALENTWTSADLVRLPLLQSALRQTERSRGAYQRLKDLLTSETRQTPQGLPAGA
jgi:colanic acid/amylovoran biosynthesis protein